MVKKEKNKTPLSWEDTFKRIDSEIAVIAHSPSDAHNKKVRFMESWNRNLKYFEKQHPLGSYERAIIKCVRDSISQSTLEPITASQALRLINSVMNLVQKGV